MREANLVRTIPATALSLTTIAAVAAVALLAGGQGTPAHHLRADNAPRVLDASWLWRPRTVADMQLYSQAVVEAKVTAVGAGQPLTGADAAMPSIPTQVISLQVLDVLKGSLAQGATIKLFQTGSGSVVLSGDPPYDVGETYTLFLIERPDGLYLPVVPDGRLLESDSGLEPRIEGPVGEDLKGKTKNDLKVLLAKGPKATRDLMADLVALRGKPLDKPGDDPGLQPQNAG
jgi:hypothetical protein